MNRLICCVLVYILIPGALAVADSDLDDARTQLKNYGLANCIVEQFKGKSDIRSDINLAIGAYSPIGAGKYIIKQNEDTLEIIYNPYVETKKFVLDAYKKAHAIFKSSGEQNVFHSCLEIYNSDAFDQFIKAQDKYLSHAPA
ncbi:hypothetical protein [Pseudomonas sp. RL_15y_Pfl2_60]|uniref:hypothetical protein n=1 Tax=Pseudomonas sp. RL_15y_Pfl2_60 TaxID=3088709 RepID=UPI0030D7ED11